MNNHFEMMSRMRDKRKPWKTKTFYGLLCMAIGMVTKYFGLEFTSVLLFDIGGLWTGYSIADRIQKK